MIAELHARRELLDMHHPPRSIYLGGGTPSLFPANQLGDIISACRNGGVAREIETTVEINPGDADGPWVKQLVAAGVNRFSLGVQAMDDARLKWLGRRHTVSDIRNAVYLLRHNGADHISVDFIYGTPRQTEAQIHRELDALCALAPGHISAYELTIADGTPLSQMGVSQIDNERSAVFWHLIGHKLSHLGFQRYEISSYARNDQRSRHNGHYWAGGTYLGIGSGAHGFVMHNNTRVRYSNDTAFNAWCDAAISPQSLAHRLDVGDGFTETIGDLDYARELIMLGLRCTDGIDLRRLAPLIEHNNNMQRQLTALQAEGWGTHAADYFIPTQDAMLMADELALRFF